MHVPITLGGRLFGVLSAMHQVPGRFGEPDLRRLASLGVGAAGAISHALEFEHERRIARALTRGYLPGPPDPQTGLELGLVYEPVAHQVGGGDVFGVWTQPSGAVARARRRRQRQGPRGRRGERDGALLRRGARVGLRAPGGGARAGQPHPAHAPAARRLRHRLPRDRRRRPAALLQRRATRRRACCAPTAAPSRSRAAGCRSASRRTAATRSASSRSGSATSSSRPRTGCSRRAARAPSSATTRLPGAARRSSAAPSPRRRSSSACSPRRRSGRRCSTTTSSCSRCGARRSSSCATSPPPARPRRRCTGSTWRLVRERLGPGLRAGGVDLRHRARVRGGARGVRRPLRPRAGRRLRRRALARPGAGRDQAHVRDGGRARPRATAAGCWPSSSGARPRRARRGCGCSRPRC